MRLLPSYAVTLADRPRVQVALGWRRSRLATRHGTGPWRYDRGSGTGVPGGDPAVDTLLIVGSISGACYDRDLVKQKPDFRGVIDVGLSQCGRDDPCPVGIHTDVQLTPRPARP
jgi:hypothetical protein